MQFTDQDQENFISRWKDSKNESLEDIALEYYRLAPKIDENDASRYAKTWDRLTRKAYDTLHDSFSEKLTLEEKLRFCLKACGAEERELLNYVAKSGRLNGDDSFGCTQFLMNGAGMWELSEQPSAEEAKLINQLIHTVHSDRSWRFKDSLYPTIKNCDCLPKELRQDVTDLIVRKHPHLLKDLKPQFHTVQTIKATTWNHSDALKLSAVISHLAQTPASYYEAVGKNTGEMPKTSVERFEKIWDALFTKPKQGTHNREDILPFQTKKLIKRQMILEDISQKRTSQLNPNDVISALTDTGAWKRKQLLSEMSDQDIQALVIAFNDFKPDYGQQPKMKGFKEALDLQYLASEKRTPKELSDFSGALRSLSSATSSKVREQALHLLKKTAETYAKKADPEASTDVGYKNAFDVCKTDERALADLNEKWGDFSAVYDAGKLYKPLVDAKNSIEKYWPKNQSFDKDAFDRQFADAVTGKTSVAVAPQVKIPLLFGKKEAREQQERLNGYIDDFNQAIQKIAKTCQNPANVAVRDNLKDLDTISSESYDRLEEECAKKEEIYKQAQTDYNASDKKAVNDAKATVEHVQRSDKTAQDNLKQATQEATNTEKRLNSLKSRLKEHENSTQTQTVGKTTGVVVRDTKVPNTNKEKTEVSAKRYLARKNAVRGSR